MRRKVIALLTLVLYLLAGPANALADYVCGQDLDGDGFADGSGETAQCLQSGADWLCPVGAVDCVQDYAEATCPEGGTLNPDRDMCQAASDVSCPTGYAHDPGIDRCVQAVQCPEEGIFNPVADRCEKIVQNECPAGYTYDSGKDNCRKAVDCSPGTLDFYRDRCETPPSWDCPAGYTYDTSLMECTAIPFCPAGSAYHSGRDRCEKAATKQCPTGYSYDAAIDNCVRAADCPAASALNAGADRCEVAVGYDCPTGYTFNPSRNQCEKDPSCLSPGAYSASGDNCRTSSTGAICPSGYSFDIAQEVCTSSPVCIGGAFNAGADRCETAPSYSCPDPTYSYDATSGRCEKIPVCAQGTYDTTYNRCLLDFTKDCPSGYSFISSRNQCERNPICDNGFTYNDFANRCEKSTTTTTSATEGWSACKARDQDAIWEGNTCEAPPGETCLTFFSYTFDNECRIVRVGLVEALILPGNYADVEFYFWISRHYNDSTPSYTCPAGYTLRGTTCSGTTLETRSPSCPNGTMDYTYDICRAPYTPDCPSDTAYDAAAQMCVQAPQCSNGLLDASADKCYQSASGGCLSGYSLNGGVCIKTPTCNSGGTFSSATDQCTYAATHTCASGYVYSSSSGECERGADCPSPGSLNGTVDQCQAGYTLSCPSGFTGSGSICYRETNCSSPGSYSSDQDKCLSTVDRICATGFAYDASTEQCWAGSDCGSGTLNTSADRCEATAMANCGSWSWDSAGQVCYSPAMCSPGAYNPGANECRATIVRDCGSYLWNETDKKCTQGVQCLDQEPDFPTASTIDFSPELDICVANSQHGCPTGYAYAGLPVAMCESPTACPEGPYDPEQNQCEGGDICPLGSQYACLGEQGATQCSPNTCFDLFAAGNDMTELPPEDPMLQNDGDVDANGNCLGDIYIFSGKAARCRPPGATVGYANDCCDSDEPALTDSTTGSRISQIASAIQTVYEVAQVGYYAYQLSTGAMAAVEVGGQVMVYNMATGSIAATYASGTATASGVMAAQGAAAAGGTSGGAVSAGISSYAGALLNPTTIVVAIVVMVVMKVMFGSGCSQQDIETAMLDNSDYCIYLGKVCERKWPLVGCVQRAKRFCCFNSTMARIVQEQGRPQLKAFGRSGSWGSAEKPNCRGFTPEEFQQLDFSLIDLTEYFGQIQKNMTQKIQDAQSAVQQKIQQHYQQIQ